MLDFITFISVSDRVAAERWCAVLFCVLLSHHLCGFLYLVRGIGGPVWVSRVASPSHDVTDVHTYFSIFHVNYGHHNPIFLLVLGISYDFWIIDDYMDFV